MKKNVEMRVGPYLIRSISHADIEATRLLRNESRDAFMHSEEISPEQQDRWFAAYLERSDDHMFVAVRDEQVVGMAGLYQLDGSRVEFGRLAIAEAERRRGLGFALTAKLMAWSFSNGAKGIDLWVKKSNVRAINLYYRLGFTHGVVTVATEDDVEIVLMRAKPSEVDLWQNWDRPGVAEQVVSYWGDSPTERAHKGWLADVVRTSAQEGSFLEAGCGSCDVYGAIRNIPLVRDYLGVDTSRAMLAIGKVVHHQVYLRVQDLRHLSRDLADTVLCFDVLGHVPGDLVSELRSLIGAARHMVIVSLRVSSRPASKEERIAGVTFHHRSRSHGDMLRAIRSAAPDSRVVHHRGYSDNVAYVIRTKQPPLVHSVIVGSYNRPTYVRKAIRSVMSQSYPHWQIIVSDDGSNEETLAGIREEFGGDDRCKLLVAADRLPDGPRPSGNVRAVERINDAIAHVTGDFVHYLPDDDWFLAGRFEAFNDSFLDPNVMMTYGVMKYADGDIISATDAIYPGRDVHDPWCQLDQTQVAHRASCFKKVPRWATENIGYAADGVFYRDLCKAGFGPVRPFAHPVSVHRRHSFNLQKGQQNATDKREG